MGDKITKSPNIRFAGFTDAWEQRKLGEVAEIVGGGTPSTGNPEYWDGDIDWYSPTEIGNHVYAKGSTKKITKLGLEKSSAKILPPDKTVLFTSRAGIGDMAILQHPGTTNQGFQSLVLKEGIDTYFIYSMGYLIRKYAKKNASGSTFLEISGRILGNMPILIPSTNEQMQIGSFFRSIDNLITLHQRKLDLLKVTKKSMLQKMFPKDGESIPEIRFKGFTDAWEQRKLEEVTEVYDGTHQTPDYKTEGIMFLSVENIKTLQSEKYISEEAFQNEFKVRPENGDVLMTRIGDVGTANVVTSNEPIAYYVSLALLKKKKLNPYFLQASIHSSAVQDEIWKRTLHIAFPKKINKNEIAKVPINFPGEQEQDNIGLFFKKLDNLITLHQRELDLLKDLKKSMLQQMFI